MSEFSLQFFQDSELLAITVICLAAMGALYLIFRLMSKKKTREERETESSLSFVTPSRHYQKYSRRDWFWILLITIPYAIVSFWQLGSTVFPTTTWQPSSTDGTQDVIFELTGDTKISAIYTIFGDGDDSFNPDSLTGTTGIIFKGSNDGITWSDVTVEPNRSVYEYNIIEGDWDYRYIKMSSVSRLNTLTELGFRNADKTAFLPVSIYQDDYADSSYPATLMIDEQQKLKVSPTYLDQAYFDEIYHPRNAWEIANNHYMYSSVHPLLGTNLIALSIKLFGMNTLAWRLPGAIAGVLIVPLIYAIGRLLFKKDTYAAIAAVLCAFDFMHLTTSRIATLEPFSVLFILAMFYFMIRYYYTSFFDTSFKKTLKMLLWSGIFMGIAIATKWTACYSAVGLAILLFSNLGRRMYEYFQAKKVLLHVEDLTDAQAHEAMAIHDFFWKKFWITIACCCVFFIVIPAVIYWLSYLPDRVWRNDTWSILNVWNHNISMYKYHTTLKATHPYSSTWYMWIIDARPIWYYFSYDMTELKHSISCFSNPLLTWLGLVATVYTIYHVISKRDRTGWVILIGYFTALVPWFIITRCVFAYHFYPASCFLIFMNVYFMTKLNDSVRKYFIIIYLVCYVALFITFLPATAGFGTTLSYIKALEWFKSWYFG